MKENDSVVNMEMDCRCGGHDHMPRSKSPSISSLKDFEEHLCLAFGLANLGKSPAVPESLRALASETNQSQQRIHPTFMSIESSKYPQNSFAGPSISTNTKRQRKNMLGEDIPVASSVRGKGKPSFIEAKNGLTQEETEDDGMEFVFLPDDSPLKGKGKAIWRKREPDLVTSYSVPDHITTRDKCMEHGGKTLDLLSRTQRRCSPATKLRLHPKQRGNDCTKDIVLVVSRAKRNENDRRK
jgi:hypothetical protein